MFSIQKEIDEFWDNCVKHTNELGDKVIWSNRLEIEALITFFINKQKQQWIDNVCEFFYDELNNGNIDCSDIECFIKKFKKIIINHG